MESWEVGRRMRIAVAVLGPFRDDCVVVQLDQKDLDEIFASRH